MRDQGICAFGGWLLYCSKMDVLERERPVALLVSRLEVVVVVTSFPKVLMSQLFSGPLLR